MKKPKPVIIKINLKLNVKEMREEIRKIIQVNLPLMNKNKLMCQEVADCILATITGAFKHHK